MNFILLPNNKYAGLNAYVTSCIAICIRVKTPRQILLGMYHWEGEGNSIDANVEEYAANALDELHEFMQVNAEDYGIDFYDKNTYVAIEIIGGEKLNPL